MAMPRLHWPLLAAAGLLLLPPRPLSVESAQRASLIPDLSFELSDSVRAILGQVSRIAVAPDSSLYLLDWQVPAILHLESSGELRRTIGRQGSGPGEFAQVYSIGLYRDSLWAGDMRQARMTLFDHQGGGAHTLPFGFRAPRVTTTGTQSIRGIPFSVFPDGSLLLEEANPDPMRPTHGLLLRTDRMMRVVDTIAQLPAAHGFMAFKWDDGEALIQQPYSDVPTYGVSADGSLLVLVSRPAATRAGDAELTVVGLRNGKEQLFSRTVSYKPRRLASRTVDSVVTAIAGSGGSDMPTPITADSIRRRLYRPAFLPPVTEVRVGRDGTVWLKVQFADSPTNADEYLQLSPRGLPLRRVTTPKGFKLLEADRKTVWGTFTDSMDVPVIQRYALDQVALN